MALTPDERDRVRYHLGFLSVSDGASIQFGLPRATQLLFILDRAMDNLLVIAEDRVRRYIKIMDDIECRLVDAQDRLAAEALGELKLRDQEPDRLEKEYVRWGFRLAGIFGVPPYAYSERYRTAVTAMTGSIPVRHG